MRAKLFGLVFFLLLLSFVSVFFLTTYGITGAVVLSESVNFVEYNMLASFQSKLVSVSSIALGIVILGTLTLGLFYRAKTKRYNELDAHLEKEINYRGLCEEIEDGEE